jgi:hypothetical protein
METIMSTVDMKIVHRMFYVAVGRARPDKALEIIELVKNNVHEADTNKGIPPSTFVDIFIPVWGDQHTSRTEFHEVTIPHSQFGRFPMDTLQAISDEMNDINNESEGISDL